MKKDIHPDYHFIDVKMRGNQVIERLYARYLPAPFLSLLIDDCIAKGRDYYNGGPRYNTNYIQCCGLGTVSDSLLALTRREMLFDAQRQVLEGKQRVLARFLQRMVEIDNSLATMGGGPTRPAPVVSLVSRCSSGRMVRRSRSPTCRCTVTC